mmetsp:Transcript_20269/g.24577  ORF Transcript_20269/g.24577 Transcript_20269/m.24577 type:complete len:233 (-) Transcript_20269:766-1464(-)|eukprot:CAMPEP_0204835102 /NCGR_PEP_ID=MMETSP1346-20131115/21614_1 /ASSEMBLY_ACC=CAM_ASM_000771 /TAXON_ID=215587 /ORGANISM="Aplanochytrium stocchinoi, Strain GSBS06" /LENGTH=232 /DNA_ID=CAMNT_0051968827 /DNA_START=148 /DNA_END=846 /DNA_ORIENTATION=-
MKSLKEKLRVEDDDRLKTIAKRTLRFSIAAFSLYLSVSVWRFATVDRYSEALEFSNAEGVSKFISGSRVLINANYAVLAFGAFLIFACGVMGVCQKSPDMLIMTSTCSFCCVLVSCSSLVSVLVSGSLCSQENRDDCGYLITVFRWTVVVSILIMGLYGFTSYYSFILVSSPKFYFIDAHGTVSPSTRPSNAQPKRPSSSRPSRPRNAKEIPEGNFPVADDIPFAEPAYEQA